MRRSSQDSHLNLRTVVLALATALSLVGSAGAVTTNWIAFNDHNPTTPPGSSAVDWNTAPNVTTYNMLGVGPNPPQPTAGPLTNFITGEELTAHVVVTANGVPDYFGAISYPNPGTLASNLFFRKVDLGNANSAIGCRHQGGNVPDTGTMITFTNLDPTKLYVFRATAVRGNNYLDRWTTASLVGAVSFTDAHSAGVFTGTGSLTNGQATWNSGENRAVGAVVGWDDIQPSAEGTFSITCRQNADNPLPNGMPPQLNNYGYAFCGFMLAETGEPSPLGITVQPPALTQVEQFRPFSISITTTGSSPVFQWYKNNSQIPGATRRTYTVNQADIVLDTADYFCIVTNFLNSVTSTVAHVNVYADTNAPTVVRAIATSPTTISVYFSEALGPSVLDPLNSELDQGFGFVDPVTINTNNPRRVDFNVVSPLTLGATYVYTALDGSVLDLAGNPIDNTRNTASFRAQFYDGNLDTLRDLPTAGMRPLGSLTNRGFDLRLVQVATNKLAPGSFNNLLFVEQLLAGTLIDPVTSLPHVNIAPVPCTNEPGTINYNKDAPATVVAPAHLGPTRPFPGVEALQPGNVIEGLAMEALCYVEFQPGIYRLGVNSDDDFRVALGTSAFDPNYFLLGEFAGAGRAAADTPFDFNVTQAGLYPIRLLYDEGAGGASIEFWSVDLLVSTNTFVGINDPAGLPAFRPPPPSLAITPAGASITLCWPAANAPYCLQSAPSLTQPIAWTDVAGPVARNAAGNCVTIPNGGSNRFYRLVLK
jgi:hypothetical protein